MIEMWFFIRKHGEAELISFTEELNTFLSNLKFTYESSKKGVPFLDLDLDF